MNYIKIILVNLVLSILIILCFEIFTGDYIRSRHVVLNHNYLVINKKLEYEVDLYTEKPIRINYERDQYGFKDRFKNIDEVDIITLGGSTTEQRYLSIENTWTDLLEKKINLNNNLDIVNAGISGQSSKGHIWSLDKWFKNIKNLKPKYIIFYMGINESDSDNGRGDPQPYQLNTVSLVDKIKKYLKINNGIIYKSYLKFTLKKSSLLNVWHNAERYDLPYKKIEPKAKKFKDKTFIKLEKRLGVITNLVNEIGAIPIFVTQKSLRWKIDSDSIYSIDNINHYNNEMKISKTIINYCIKNNIKYINGFEKLDLIKKDTWDLVHTTPSGSNKIANLIFNETFNLF